MSSKSRHSSSKTSLWFREYSISVLGKPQESLISGNIWYVGVSLYFELFFRFYSLMMTVVGSFTCNSIYLSSFCLSIVFQCSFTDIYTCCTLVCWCPVLISLCRLERKVNKYPSKKRGLRPTRTMRRHEAVSFFSIVFFEEHYRLCLCLFPHVVFIDAVPVDDSFELFLLLLMSRITIANFLLVVFCWNGKKIKHYFSRCLRRYCSELYPCCCIKERSKTNNMTEPFPGESVLLVFSTYYLAKKSVLPDWLPQVLSKSPKWHFGYFHYPCTRSTPATCLSRIKSVSLSKALWWTEDVCVISEWRTEKTTYKLVSGFWEYTNYGRHSIHRFFGRSEKAGQNL
jgi:hypothetical protein